MLKDLIRNHKVFVKLHLIAKSKAIRTGTKRIIKGKASRLYLINADTAVRAGKALAEIHWSPHPSHPQSARPSAKLIARLQ